MKWIGGLISLGLVCFGLFYKYDQYQKNQRTERLNERIYVMNAMVDITNDADANQSRCFEHFVEWYTGAVEGDRKKVLAGEMFSDSCGENARAIYTAGEVQSRAETEAPDSDLKDAFVRASLDLLSEYKQQGRDFDEIYEMFKTATDRGDSFEPLADRTNELLDNKTESIDAAFEVLETAKSAYYNEGRK